MKTSHWHEVKTFVGGEYVHFDILAHLHQNKEGLLPQADSQAAGEHRWTAVIQKFCKTTLASFG